MLLDASPELHKELKNFDEIRRECHRHGLITDEQNEELIGIQGQIRHNERLLGMLNCDVESMTTFTSILRRMKKLEPLAVKLTDSLGIACRGHFGKGENRKRLKRSEKKQTFFQT